MCIRPFAPTSPLPGASTSPPPFRNNGARLEHDARPVRTFQKRSRSTGNRWSLLVRATVAILGIPHAWQLLTTLGYSGFCLRTGFDSPRLVGPLIGVVVDVNCDCDFY